MVLISVSAFGINNRNDGSNVAAQSFKTFGGGVKPLSRQAFRVTS